MITILVLTKVKSEIKLRHIKKLTKMSNKKESYESSTQQNIYVSHKYLPEKQKQLELSNDQRLLNDASSSPTYSKVDFDCPQYNSLLSQNSYNPLKSMYFIEQINRTNQHSDAEV